MKNSIKLILILLMTISVQAQSIIAEDVMKKAFQDYYSGLIEQETHYNETVFEMKNKFSTEQAARKNRLLSNIRKTYGSLALTDKESNRSKLSEIRTLRDNFNKSQKKERDFFKKSIFSKKKNFEDLRLKKKSEFEIQLRKWRAQ